jgi:hypothetical protein
VCSSSKSLINYGDGPRDGGEAAGSADDVTETEDDDRMCMCFALARLLFEFHPRCAPGSERRLQTGPPAALPPPLPLQTRDRGSQTSALMLFP